MKLNHFQGRAVVAAFVLSALTAVSASANCGISGSSNPQAYQHATQSFKRMQDKLQSLRAARALASDGPEAGTPTIVGLWHVAFLLDPNGGFSTAGPNVFDEGFDAWHADGTETLNDIPVPASGNVCLGTWTQSGPLTYLLKHVTWVYDPTNTTLVAVGTITEQITLDAAGNHYTGTATFNGLDLTGANVFQMSTSIVAERILADSQVFQPTPGPAPAITAVVTPATLTTSQTSVVLDGSGSTGVGPLTYFYSVVAGGKVPALLQSASNPKATVDFVNGAGTYIVQLTVTDSAGNTATSQPVMLTYKP